MDGTTKIDRLSHLADPSAQASVDDRTISHFYPYLDMRGGRAGDERAAWEQVFVSGSENLFVYPRIDLPADVGSAPPRKGEPLAVTSSNPDSTSVRTADGEHFSVPTQLLTADKPSAYVIADRRRPGRDAKDLSDAQDLATTEDQPEMDKLAPVRERYHACWMKFMEKNDPTFKKNYDVVKLYSDGRVSEVGDEWADKAARKCGLGVVRVAEKTLKRVLDDRREKRQAESWKAIRARFAK